ncbi:nucleotidyltransferase domain-containing protein [Staphylothermus hellenicus]|uniref:DNA polymerase beta domain protein region n=1 Tax=Staphylothermus hellenicus (strain DSM 12710 / JCM 10830 / BK20S6-10-b1 / P8) TaxID=591019 RepID=D7DAP5_STAHD|nr:nucleotidyltransferase domain-containing protein [Staphylothermus hellenicus]ADI31242.1 DNA polymerase beta domain protein region [Staphylothermus hellenicus DSM 12710]
MFRKGLNNIPEPFRTLVSRLLAELLRLFNGRLKSLVVYGSVARGDYRKDSDIDLLIIIEGLPRSRLERIRLFTKAESKLDELLDKLLDKGYAVSFSPIIKTPEEAVRISPIYLDMVEDAIIVYDENGFFEKILMGLKKKLEQLGAERVRLGKKWYWRLKKNYRFGEVISIE